MSDYKKLKSHQLAELLARRGLEPGVSTYQGTKLHMMSRLVMQDAEEAAAVKATTAAIQAASTSRSPQTNGGQENEGKKGEWSKVKGGADRGGADQDKQKMGRMRSEKGRQSGKGKAKEIGGGGYYGVLGQDNKDVEKAEEMDEEDFVRELLAGGAADGPKAATTESQHKSGIIVNMTATRPTMRGRARSGRKTSSTRLVPDNDGALSDTSTIRASSPVAPERISLPHGNKDIEKGVKDGKKRVRALKKKGNTGEQANHAAVHAGTAAVHNSGASMVILFAASFIVLVLVFSTSPGSITEAWSYVVAFMKDLMGTMGPKAIRCYMRYKEMFGMTEFYWKRYGKSFTYSPRISSQVTSAYTISVAMAPRTLEELDAWAQDTFPEEFAIFKAEVDKIMTPTSIPYGYKPNYPNGPKPKYKDWVMPDPESRNKLKMQSHLVLVIGTFKKADPKRLADKLIMYMTNGEYLNFGRMVYTAGNKLPKYEAHLDSQSTLAKDVFMFSFWKRITNQDPKKKYGTLVKTVALYLHLVRQLLADFRGPYGVEERFEAAVKAYAADRRAKEQAVANKATKRGRDSDSEQEERSKRAKGPEDRVKELEAELQEVKKASAKRVKDLEVEVGELKAELSQLKADSSRKKELIKQVLDGEYRMSG
ncbi:hypothetical protein P171DRAFT_448190 [Karstenula rhodostoma CBS 690.94]|uniref:Uncharacterized protein n=1 Tax=Karstenula rhodostoma CBS 690.94 TaxID=1392251 RepID=A0A9P4PAA9_9PLEO|nr:hypothetical protein P171DRAFT_448190 [Karstenula rhodostoma CBS 690.94]